MGIFIIAEAGVNHNGSLSMAKKLVYQAKQAGADCIKFQTFKAEKLVTKDGAKADYQKVQTGAEESQLEMLKKLELSQGEFRELAAYCKKEGILFLSTAFDMESLEFLEELKLPCHKVPSGEITNYPYLAAVGRTGKPVILSTGMCGMEEVEEALHVLREYGAGEIVLLHCTSEYPAPLKDVNLRAMAALKERFGCKVGYSDHTVGIEIPLAAAALGAVVIEKHFTLDRDLEGPDHKASLVPDELARMSALIRHVELALGDGEKKAAPGEMEIRKAARKSIVAARKIKKGECFTEENLTVKRPGDGLSPMKWKQTLGQTAKRDFLPDERIEL